MALNAQQKSLRIEVFQGINKILIGEKPSDTKVGYSGAIGVSFKCQGKKSTISFEPQILVTNNSFLLKINESYRVKINQQKLSFMPIAGISISENVVIRSGLFLSTGEVSKVRLVYRDNSSYLNVGKSEFDENYRPTLFQAGVVAGVAFCFGEKKNWNFNILLEQFGNSFLAEDYSLNGQPFIHPSKTSFSSRSKPTAFLLGLNYALPKASTKKKKVADTE